MELLLSMVPLHLAAAILKRKTGINSSAAYLTALMAAVMFMYFGGLINMLLPATVLCMVIPVTTVAFMAFREGTWEIKNILKEYFDVFVALNIAFCIGITIIYLTQQPRFYYWDEFTFWGISTKLTKTFNRLYSIPPVYMALYRLPCGNRVMNYLFSFFASDFSDWHLMASYSYMFFAVFSAAASLVKQKTNNKALSFITYFVLVLMPFMSIFHHPSPDYSSLSYAYGTGMVDFNIAVIFLGVVTVYLASTDKKLYLLPLMYITTVKNTSIFFSLLAAAVVLCIMLFDKEARPSKTTGIIKNIIIILVVPAVVYFSWNVHLDFYSTPAGQGKYDIRPQAVRHTVQEDTPMAEQEPKEEQNNIADNSGANILSIFVPSMRTPRYRQVLADMKNLFETQAITMLGKDRLLVVILFITGIITALTASKGKKLSVLLTNIGLGTGAWVYCVVISYFISAFTDGMVEYPRYMTSYYFSWFAVTILLFAINCKSKVRPKLALTAVMLITMRNIYRMDISHTVFAAPDNAYKKQMTIEEELKDIKNVVNKNDRIYLLLPDQDTEGYLYYGYTFLPAVANRDTKKTGIDFTISFREEIDWSSDRTYYNVASPQTFGNIMQDYFDYVYVISPDEEVVQSYGGLFSDGMEKGGFYKVTDGQIPMQRMIFNG